MSLPRNASLSKKTSLKLDRVGLPGSPTRLLVVGYYNHSNLGDEQYKSTITHLMKRFFIKNTVPPEITFIDCDQLKDYQLLPHTAVILGGGDVLNPYFLDKMYAKFVLSPDGPPPLSLVACSVGVPYNDIYLQPEHRKKLEMFDAIFLRTKQDLHALQTHLPPEKIHYFPDTSCFALEYIANTNQFKQAMVPPFFSLYCHIQSTRNKRKIVGVMLCRHIYHPTPEYRPRYQEIVQHLANLLMRLVKMKYMIVLVPFNTKPLKPGESSDTNKENDVLIQQDVLKCMHPSYLPSIVSVDFKLTLEQTMLLYKMFYMTIPMRFHATLFSTYMGVPMIPVFTTKKITNFLRDIDWKYGVRMERDSRDLPISLDEEQWFALFRQLVRADAYLSGKNRMLDATQEFKRATLEKGAVLRMELQGEGRRMRENIAAAAAAAAAAGPPPSARTVSFLLSVFDTPHDDAPGLADVVSEGTLSLVTPHQVQEEKEDRNGNVSPSSEMNRIIQRTYTKLQQFAAEYGAADFRELSEPQLQQIAVCVVSYYLTGNIDSRYNHGLQEKMFCADYPYLEEWSWVWKHARSQSYSLDVPPEPGPFSMRFNLDYIDQNDRSGVHRSGWKYVYDAVHGYHDPHANLFLDLYVDRTFHWKRDIYKHVDLIPYTRPWIGVIHHTFEEEFTPYNTTALLQCPEFVASLGCCRGLIVLSKTLQTQLLNRLPTDIPVHVVTHPTEMDVSGFQYSAFIRNPDKKLLHIGGWMRNLFSFYQMELAPSYVMIQPTSEWKRVNEHRPWGKGKEREEREERMDNLLSKLAPEEPPGSGDSTKERTPTVRRWFKCFSRPSVSSPCPSPCCCCCTKGVKTAAPITHISSPEHLPGDRIPPAAPRMVVTTTEVTLRKLALKGRNMDNYYPPAVCWGSDPSFCCEGLAPTTSLPYCSSNAFASSSPFASNQAPSMNRLATNNWMKHLWNYIRRLCMNQAVADYMDNASYDELLTKNVVFLNLVDGSAVNTLLECLVRHTPVFVNRHPAVVEVLGESYPMYFHDPSEVHTMLSQHPQLIYNTHLYLKKLDKTPYKIETFLATLNAIITESHT